MTQAEAGRAGRLQSTAEEVHLDALRHPDPCGTALMLLLQSIQKHIAEEAQSTDAYAHLAVETPDAVVASVMRLLREDEERHHRQLEQIGQSLRDQLNWTTTAAPAAPIDAHTVVQIEGEWIRQIHQFADEERKGSHELRNLAHRARVQGDPLVCLLLESMAMDSDKHAHWLHFVEHRMRSSVAGSRTQTQ